MPLDYNKTLNLPNTEFSMRAALPTREPEMLQNWSDNKLFETLMQDRKDNPKYILHDGPPYANGEIHLGTAMNKTIKDIITRQKTMAGFRSPYVPGWDTHGLPIELKALKAAGDNKNSISKLELRRLCREYAEKYIDIQRRDFLRLGVLGDFFNPYKTLAPSFEARQIQIFGEMAKKGYIYKGLKAVYWCADCKTALAEAEIEYANDPCDTLYVSFDVQSDGGVFVAAGVPIENISFLIWTTTAWTLPGNVAICLGPEFEYALVSANGRHYVIADKLVAEVMETAGIKQYKTVAKYTGKQLERIVTKHPFLNRTSLVIVGDHVTLESGTGCVHTAPGHGVEDFEVVTKNYPELEVIVPVDENGLLTELAGQFAGISTEKANKPISEHLAQVGHLFATTHIVHSYPHCWRCQHPVIYRATEQWFCSVDDFKAQTAQAIKNVHWTPAWGEERMASMVRERSDWCISRQRTWGVPIPAFYCVKCGQYHITDESIEAVSSLFRKEGSDAWYKYEAAEILPQGTKCAHCGGTEFTKETDIMDVWFDSGSSHAAVLDERPELSWPADLYVEGGDQYRGWFQSSLLTAVAWRGEAPYKNVLSHGWTIDQTGNKMSKSMGNGISPQDIIKVYGADILRLWVASSDYQVDIRISDEILKQLSESYRKIRNTARFILGNISDFDPDTQALPLSELTELDRFILAKLNALVKTAEEAYDVFEFHGVTHSLINFCVVDLSNFYLDIIKDRLYVNAPGSTQRRGAQTVMHIILTAIAKIVAPILVFTSQEIWEHMPAVKGKKPYIVMEYMPKPFELDADDAFMAKWGKLIAVRDDVKKALEIARNAKIIGSSLEADVELVASGEYLAFLKANESMLAELFIVSQLKVTEGAQGEFAGENGLFINTKHAQGEKCERCWSYTGDVGSVAEHATICKRCATILENM